MGSQLELVTVTGGGHGWFQTADFSTADYVMLFFARVTAPPPPGSLQRISLSRPEGARCSGCTCLPPCAAAPLQCR